MTASLSVSDGPNLHWFRLAFRLGNPAKSTTRQRVEESYEASTRCQDRDCSWRPRGVDTLRMLRHVGAPVRLSCFAVRDVTGVLVDGNVVSDPSCPVIHGAVYGLRGWCACSASPLTGSFLAPGSDPGVLPAPVIIADEDNNRLVIVDPQGRTLWEFP